jgi:membrane peptidoglycan carboxypeptidase
VANRQAGAVAQGASTLTMQYVRNTLRDSAQTPEQVQAATVQTPGRKLHEMRLAVELERRMTKNEILERYLNVAYFGHRAYGIAAAAEVYYSKRPADLTLAEAATLAGLVQAPTAYDPADNPVASAQRRDFVIDRMLGERMLTPADAALAKAEPITLQLTEPPAECVAVPSTHNDWGFFCDLFKSWWSKQPAFGASPEERLDLLRRGGYSVVTTLDPRLQASTQANVLAKEKVTSPYAHGVVAVQPGTGQLKAVAINRVYSVDQSHNGQHTDPLRRSQIKGTYPNTVNTLLGGGDLPGYQAGSTFKLFVLLAALEGGLPLSTTYYSPQRYTSAYPGSPGEPASCGNRWCPSNDNAGMTGTHTAWSGFGKSVNTYWVQVEQKVGAEKAVRMAERLGLRWRSAIDQRQASPEHAPGWGAFTLGVADTTPLEMANAYATIAADGVYCEPIPVVSIAGPDGATITAPGPDGAAIAVAAPRCNRAVAPEVARGAVDAARCVTGYGAAMGGCGGWSTAPEVYRLVKRPVAGKTGTTDNNRAAWFVGITPGLAVASFIADPDNPFNAVGGANHWKPLQSAGETLRDGSIGTPVRDFTAPPPAVVGAASGNRRR